MRDDSSHSGFAVVLRGGPKDGLVMRIETLRDRLFVPGPPTASAGMGPQRPLTYQLLLANGEPVRSTEGIIYQHASP